MRWTNLASMPLVAWKNRAWGKMGWLSAVVALALCSTVAFGQLTVPPPAPAPAPLPPPQSHTSIDTAITSAVAIISANPDRHAAPRRQAIEQLRKLLNDHPQAPSAHLAALALVDDRQCETDAGYPDCAAWAIRNYELFLRAYPYSSRRSYVLKRLVVNYLDLSFRYEEDKPWRSAEKAELCLGRALELSEALAGRGDAEAAFGVEMAARIRTSGKAFSIVPGRL